LSIDLNITLFIQHFRSGYVTSLLTFVSLFGYGFFKYVILGLCAGFLYLRKLSKEAGMLVFSTLGADLTSNLLKVIIMRPRPNPKLIFQLGQFTLPDSFPSGHVVFYVGFFGFVFFLIFKLIRHRRIKTLAILFCLFFIVLVGPSRIYLGAHWFTDVIGGYFLGFLWLVLSINIYNYWISKNKNEN
jgi:undecaprenyl-diphosphatase